MRVPLDESLPRDLAERLTGHQVEPVHDRGWDGLTNGELLRVSAAAGFAVLMTVDQSLEFQQNIPASGVALVVLTARTNRLPDLLPLVPVLLQSLPKTRPGRVTHVGV